MRLAGKTDAEIAARLRYASLSGANKAARRGRDASRRKLEPLEWRLEYARLEQVHAALWPMLEAPSVSDRSRMRVVRLLTEILDLEYRLTAGFLYSPEQDGTPRGQTSAAELQRRGCLDVETMMATTEARIGQEDGTTNTWGDEGEWSQALELRCRGLTLEEVAVRLGLSGKSAAGKRVRRDLDRYRRTAVDAHLGRCLHLINTAHQVHWPAATRELGDDTDFPDLNAVAAVLRLVEERCELLGLFPDAPPLLDPYAEAGLVLVTGVRTCN